MTTSIKAFRAAVRPIREPWVRDAACARGNTNLPANLWDVDLDAFGDAETEQQRIVRQTLASWVCRNRCSVRAECHDHQRRTKARRQPPGVRGGQIYV